MAPLTTVEQLRRLHRDTVRINLDLRKILAHLGLDDVTEAEIDAVLEAGQRQPD